MKITDDQLMKAIWLYQLKRMAKGVVDHYFGQRFAVKGSSDSDLYFSSYIHFGETAQINVELSENQRLGASQRRVRIKRLIQQGKLHQEHNDRSFYIKTSQSREAFEYARDFWIKSGVPAFKSGTATPVPLAEIKRLGIAMSCFEQLLDWYGELEA